MRIDKQRSTERHWWTWAGRIGQQVALMQHASETDAEYHYSLMRTLGGDFNRIGRTTRAADESTIVGHLTQDFTSVRIIPDARAQLAAALPALNPTATEQQHANAAARIVADMIGGAA